MEGRTACLMANHGLVCLGQNLSMVLALAIEIEHLARTYSQCLSLGDPIIIDDEEMDRVIEKFRHYGAKNVT